MLKIKSILAVVAVIALASPVLAEGDKAPAVSKVRGEISKIDGNAVTLKSKGDGGAVKEVTVTVAETTKIMVPDAAATAPADGAAPAKRPYKEGKISDLKVGDRVGAAYGADNVAVRIEVMPAMAPKAGKAPREGKGGDAVAPKHAEGAK